MRLFAFFFLLIRQLQCVRLISNHCIIKNRQHHKKFRHFRRNSHHFVQNFRYVH